ncbi:uncharacterized protein LOC123987876 isoform X2 [Osmia bicornis bicornis]|uniref:uncharacterized protein LOC123987876 isoform X2 n=1 Tax=Osmia bicornis bicornis TaxID=1437191 RepID=UPI001EAF43C9|nr:uncharacterized protein LOC123987876 isoform X2 [Osmia bicornis bicornis]XP_046142111.1 uncharacterized protein LOC123987876 isoform X2 [Osmia bicornis bicornis]
MTHRIINREMWTFWVSSVCQFERLENTRLSIHSAGLLPNTRYHLKCQCWHLISIAQIPYALTSQLLRFLRGSGIKGDDAHPGSEGVRQ